MRWWTSLTLDLPPGAQQLVEETDITPTIANNKVQQSQRHRAARGGGGVKGPWLGCR